MLWLYNESPFVLLQPIAKLLTAQHLTYWSSMKIITRKTKSLTTNAKLDIIFIRTSLIIRLHVNKIITAAHGLTRQLNATVSRREN